MNETLEQLKGYFDNPKKKKSEKNGMIWVGRVNTLTRR